MLAYFRGGSSYYIESIFYVAFSTQPYFLVAKFPKFIQMLSLLVVFYPRDILMAWGCSAYVVFYPRVILMSGGGFYGQLAAQMAPLAAQT